ncbi:MAG: beta-propeller domain-containing protein [Lachnospiraceae bacterium]
MDQKDLLEKIKYDAKDLPIPDSLQPDSIEKLLQENSRSRSTDTTDFERAAKRRQLRRRWLRFGSAAAVFALTGALLWQSSRIEKYQKTEEAQEMQMTAETKEARQPDQTDAEKIKAAPAASEAFTYAESPKAIYEALYEQFCSQTPEAYAATSMARTELLQSAADVESAIEDTSYTAPADATGTDFSQTNLQELGVDEGDIVKTDGEYIYILRTDLSLAIAQIRQGRASLLGVTPLGAGDNGYAHEMYLEGDCLYIITSESVTSLEQDEDVYYTSTGRQTMLLTYDVSDPGAPVQKGAIAQEGSYAASRKNDGFIYLFTSYSPDIRDTFEDSTIMPRINQTELSAGDIYLPDSMESTSYLVISSMKTDAPDEIFDSKALVSGASHYYVSPENIYIANERCDASSVLTEITKFHYADGEITGVAAGCVPGYLNNSFSMNEYNGKLRVVSTYTDNKAASVSDSSGASVKAAVDQEEYNALYILDEAMKQIGAIEDLAKGETIRSARFSGDTGYFVTFEQTDPLFCVDLSDPEHPQLVGELKVSGFSSYLHFYGEDRLLGIGYEADPETGSIEGLKLSMFDISDPADIKEIHRTVIPGITWCPAIEDHKAILADAKKNVIGFYCDNRYLVFSYDETEGFTSELVYDFYSDMLVNQAEYNTMRGLYIDDTLYLAGDTFLISFDMKKDFEKTDVIKISKET